jgi:hypothetical protein
MELEGGVLGIPDGSGSRGFCGPGSGLGAITMVILFSPFIRAKTTHDILILPMIHLFRRESGAPPSNKLAGDVSNSVMEQKVIERTDGCPYHAYFDPLVYGERKFSRGAGNGGCCSASGLLPELFEMPMP